MKIAVLADIHGNLPALDAVLAEIQQEDIKRILIAGDLTRGAPYQNEVIQRLRLLNVDIIKGNVDDFFLRIDAGITPPGWGTNRQWAFAYWAYQNLNRESLDFLKLLPEQKVISIPQTTKIRVVHGSPRNIGELILPSKNPALLEKALAMIDESVLIFAHTHKLWNQKINGRLALNPGSVCFSTNGVAGAHYAIMTWVEDQWEAELRSASYDFEQIRESFAQSGLLEEGGILAEAFLLSIEMGKDFFGGIVTYINNKASAKGYDPRKSIPNEIWEQLESSWVPYPKK